MSLCRVDKANAFLMYSLFYVFLEHYRVGILSTGEICDIPQLNKLTKTQLSDSVGMSLITISLSEGQPAEM